jgi:hypothetical protein
MAHELARYVIDMDRPNAIIDEIRFGSLYKENRNMISLYYYYRETGDELARKALLKGIDHTYRFNRVHGAFSGQSYPSFLFSIAYRWTQDPNYLRVIGTLIDEHRRWPEGANITSQINPTMGVPAALEAICLRCLERDPGARYASAAALADDLERFVAGEPVEAQRMGAAKLVRRWMRHHPSLGWRVVAFATFYAVTWFNHAVLGVVDAAFVLRISALLAAWALAAFAFDRVGRHGQPPGWLPFAWVGVDAALFSCVLLVADGPVSSLVVGYMLLVAVSGYWARTGPVWWAAGLSLLSYGLLWAEASARRPQLAGSLDRHLVFATAVLVLAGVVSRYVARTRALARLLRTRP